MTAVARSTIAALFYAKKIRIDFATLKHELRHAIAASNGTAFRVCVDYDDFIMFDVGGGRVCLGYGDFTAEPDPTRNPDAPKECLIVSVGAASYADDGGPVYESRTDLCRALANEIETSEPADLMMMIEREEVVTADIHDRIIDLLREMSDKPIASAPAERPRKASVSATKVRRVIPRPTHAPASADPEGAQHLKALPAPAQMDLTRKLRDAIYSETEDEITERELARSLTRRIAIYTLNGSVILLSAPIGMAALTYCALGRENAAVPARALAVTGALIGFAHAGLAPGLLGQLI